jgi:hypothetical protein
VSAAVIHEIAQPIAVVVGGVAARGRRWGITGLTVRQSFTQGAVIDAPISIEDVRPGSSAEIVVGALSE